MDALVAGNAGKGKQQIKIKLEKMQRQQKELERVCADAERNGNLTANAAQEVEETIEHIPSLELDAATALDNLETEEKLERVESTQRPRTQFPTFEGQADQLIEFKQLATRIQKLYSTPEQQVLQLVAVCEESIAKTVRRPTTIERAMEDLASRYGHPHLYMDELLQNLKELRTSRNAADVPATTELILGILEAITSLQQTDQLQLPVDSMNQIFRAVRLDPTEMKEVLDFVRRKEEVPLWEIRDWVRCRYQDYSLIQQRLIQTEKD